MIEFESVTLTYKNAEEPTLRNVTLQIPDGQSVLVCGASGTGKTTLTRLINGLATQFDEASVEGRVLVDGLDVLEAPLYETGRRVGNVFQNPRSQFFCVDVTSEMAFGCENLGMEPGEVSCRVARTARSMGMEDLLGADIFKISGGQKQKVACASVAAMDPDVFVLDEPSSNFDAVTVDLLRQIIVLWRQRGKTVVVAEHRLGWLTEACERVIVMADGGVAWDGPMEDFVALGEEARARFGLRPLRGALGARVTSSSAADGDDAALGKEPTFQLQNFTYSYSRDQRLTLDIPTATLPVRKIIGLIGPNGSGKTTLSHCLCGVMPRFRGNVMLDGVQLGTRELLKRCYLVMQDVNHQLFCETVADEVRLGMDASREGDVEAILGQLGLAGLEDRHPFSLSGGQKQRVAIAAALLAGKDILVFDEPTSGQDLRNMRATARLIGKLEGVATVIVVTHDRDFIHECCTHVMRIDEGRLTDIYPLDERGRAKVNEFFDARAALPKAVGD